MNITQIPEGFALYKEKDEIGRCALTPTQKGEPLARSASCPSGGGKATAPIS